MTELMEDIIYHALDSFFDKNQLIEWVIEELIDDGLQFIRTFFDVPSRIDDKKLKRFIEDGFDTIVERYYDNNWD